VTHRRTIAIRQNSSREGLNIGQAYLVLPYQLASEHAVCLAALNWGVKIGRSAMSHRTKMILITLSLLNALNAVALAFNLSQPARAAVRGMSYQDLLRDSDFTRAVKTIAEQCSVNVDLAKLKCQGG
jgi:hypothetical protein